MSKPPRDDMGVKDVAVSIIFYYRYDIKWNFIIIITILFQMKRKLHHVKVKALKKGIAKYSRKGEGDRHVFDLKPKHLFVGKRGVGKTDRR